MKESTTASNETTKNFIKAVNDALANPPVIKKLITRLVYEPADGKLLHITVDDPKSGETWIEIDNSLIHQYNPSNKFLRVVKGKVVSIKQSNGAKTVQLVPGDTWHADKEYRLITGEPSVNTSGWSRKTD